MLLSPVFQKNLVAVAVNEPHCFKKWSVSLMLVSLSKFITSSHFTYYRGENLEVRSLIPKETRIMALTATATVKTRHAICKTLGMSDPVVIADFPNKPNIKYTVYLNPGTVLEEIFASVVKELQLYRIYTEWVIIFCCVMFLTIMGLPRGRDFILTYVLKCIHVHHYMYLYT